ncbi:AraC family transcriptional regulator [Aegicerativicinus sediminis]
MKPILFKIPKSSKASILIQVDEERHFYDKLHYHPEFQITLVEKGDGLFFGGVGMGKFAPGDIFFVGQSTPHLLKSSKRYYQENSSGVKSISVFFNYNSFGDSFFELPEMRQLKKLLEITSRVIKVSEGEQLRVGRLIQRMLDLKEHDRIIGLMEILRDIANSEVSYINSEVVTYQLKEQGIKRLDSVLNYTFTHYSETIHIDQIADLANLSRSQFSRYFKERTGKSYMAFLNEVRIENACSMLLDSQSTIEAISYDVGFQNLSNFNRQFKKIKNLTPSAFRNINQL